MGPPSDFPELEGHAGDGVAGSGAVLAAPYVALPLQCGHIGRGLGGYNCVEFAFKVGGIEVILMMRRQFMRITTVYASQNRLRRDRLHPAHGGVCVAPRFQVLVAQIIWFCLRLDGDRLAPATAHSFI